MTETTDIGICAPVSLLSETTDKYLAIRGVDKKKYYSKYLIIAGEIWKEVFQKTLFSTKSVWKELKAGNPYSYIDKPKDCNRLFSVATTDQCNNIQPLFYNSQLNVIPKPTTRHCSCGACDCDLCEDINSTVVTTKELFTISGITYYQKCWLKYCRNGDILEYCETPTKKYNSFAGDGGDFNDDFNNDYDIGSNPLADFTITTVISQRKICTLATRLCGCPEPTQENQLLIQEHCGCLFSIFSRNRRRCCKVFIENVNNNHFGEVKLSECGTRIYFKPSRHSRHAATTQNPDFLLVNYQTTGMNPDSEVQVPQYAERCMFAGIDYLSKQYNNTYSPIEKKDAYYHYVDEQNKIIIYLNPISLSLVNATQDVAQKW